MEQARIIQTMLDTPSPKGEPWRLRAQGRGGYVQAGTGGESIFGADRVVAYKVETYCPRRKGLPVGLVLCRDFSSAHEEYGP